jgi:hypothetical protein
MRPLYAFVAGALTLLAVVAAMTRILTFKNSPAYIRNMAEALSNLFKGVFGQ